MKTKRDHYTALGKATHSYLGRLTCGCAVAVTVDCGDRVTAKCVAEFVRDGLTIERVTHAVVRETHFGCVHKEQAQQSVQLALETEAGPDSAN